MIFAPIKHVKNKLLDMKTIHDLCLGAEEQATANGETLPGAEHFLLSALILPDGTAKDFFHSLGIGIEEIKHAIKQQHLSALDHLGIDRISASDYFDDEPIATTNRLFKTQPSAKTLMKTLYENNKHRSQPLSSIHVIEAILSMEYGFAIRALKALDLNIEEMKQAVQQEIL